MESIKELFRIGPGPSSSHSLGVRRGCEYYHERYPDHQKYLVELYGSLSLTGKGHMTDKVISDYFGNDHVEVVFLKEDGLRHPNTMKLYCLENGNKINEMIIYSVGGGAIEVEGEPPLTDDGVYPHRNLTEILKYCQENSLTLYQYVYQCEPDIREYLNTVASKMIEVIQRGLNSEGYLPGELHLEKVAHRLYEMSEKENDPINHEKLRVTAYAYGAMEESSSGHEVVTAPTLGASGVVSSLVRYYYTDKGAKWDKILDSLAVAGLIGNIVKHNASISGAQGGCQAEIGTACAMGAALVAALKDMNNHQIEYAAEIGIEHNLGLTCDPVGGYVQIPCIERNGVAALRSIDAATYAGYLSTIRDNKVSFDMAVHVMKYTGKQIPVELRETSLGGLAMELRPEKRQEDL